MGLLFLVLSYILGSIPFSIVVAKIFFKKDIRNEGSGNPGTTNVIRTCNVYAGIAVFLLDILKAGVPVLIARKLNITLFGFDNELIYGAAAIFGHTCSIFLNFKGGKGAASALGAVFFYNPLWGLIGFTLAIVIFIITRFVSLCSLIVASSMILIAIIFKDYSSLVSVVPVVILIFVKHKANIIRLINHNENKLKFKK